MPVNRLFEILYVLLEKEHVTATQLAQRFEVSVRTIYRDIDTLSSAGIPVYATQGKGGGISLLDHYVLDRAAFSPKEQEQLLTALQSLPSALLEDGAATLSKLSALFKRKEADWIQVDLSRWGCFEADTRQFDLIKSAILGRKAAQMVYAGADGSVGRRVIWPARLVFKGRGWYVQGWCPEKEDYRTFKLSRIQSFQPLEETVLLPGSPPSIDPEETENSAYFPPLVLRFLPFLAYRVYDEFSPECITREVDGSLTVRVSFPLDNWVTGYLLSFGTGVQVVEPVALKHRVAALAKEVFEQSLEPDTGCQGSDGILRTSKKKEDVQMEQTNQTFCQSCGMPLSDASLLGTEADGSPSRHYCKYCYDKGAFSGEMTMEQMIDFCAPMMVQGNPGMTQEQAKQQMAQYFPQLLRWKKA